MFTPEVKSLPRPDQHDFSLVIHGVSQYSIAGQTMHVIFWDVIKFCEVKKKDEI